VGLRENLFVPEPEPEPEPETGQLLRKWFYPKALVAFRARARTRARAREGFASKPTVEFCLESMLYPLEDFSEPVPEPAPVPEPEWQR
jgi:hypothetical protein